MTPQEIFDKAVNGVIEQGALCKNEKSDCRYRLNGMKCAVGHLIPDANYDAKIEGKNPEFKEVQDAIPADVSASVSWEWLSELQVMHDDAETIADFKSNAANFAKKNGLKFEAAE